MIAGLQTLQTVYHSEKFCVILQLRYEESVSDHHV